MKRKKALSLCLTLLCFSMLSMFSVNNNFLFQNKAQALVNTDGSYPDPSWWNGSCDSNRNTGSSSSDDYRGVKECQGGAPIDTYSTNIGGSINVGEWECIELAFRYLKVAYGINDYSLDGGYAKNFVNDFNNSPSAGGPNDEFKVYGNGSAHNAPQAGDVISYNNPGNSSDPGHVAIVKSSNVDPGTGSGSFTILQENGSTPTVVEYVTAWTVQDLSSVRSPVNWLHDEGGTNPSTIKNQYSALETFSRDRDGFIEHSWQQSGGGWSGWSLINGGSMNRFIGDPAAVLNSNYIEVFAVGMDHNLYNAANNGGTWSNWSLYANYGDIIGDPVVINDSSGLVNVFARESNGYLLQNAKTCAGACAWSGWYNLTSSDRTNNVNGSNVWLLDDDPTVYLRNDNKLEVFARTKDNSQSIFYVAQTSPGTNSWGYWRSLGGDALDKQSVVRNMNGELEIFAKATDSSIWHTWENTPGASGSGIDPGVNWHGWTQLAAGWANNPVAAVNSNGLMEVFVRDGGMQIDHNYQHSDGSWSGWSVVNDMGNVNGNSYWFAGNPDIVMDSGNSLNIFVRGMTNNIYTNWQNSPFGATNWAYFTGSDNIGSTTFR